MNAARYGIGRETPLNATSDLDVKPWQDQLFELLKKGQTAQMEIMEPQPDIIAKLRDQYRYTIMLKGKNLKAMIKMAKSAIKALKKKGVLITLNVDP